MIFLIYLLINPSTKFFGTIRQFPYQYNDTIFPYNLNINTSLKIGIITDNKTINASFYKCFEKYKLIKIHSYVKRDTDLLMEYSFDAFIEIIYSKNNTFQFKLTSKDLKFKIPISDAESSLYFPQKFESNSYLVYSSLVYEFLLYHNQKIDKKNNFTIINSGFNNYKYTKYSTSEIIYSVPIFISIVYGLIFLSFSLRMIYEREKKLDILLKRHGMKKKDYLISWFITYILLTSFTTISTIICSFIVLLRYFDIIIFAISHILFSIGIFSMSFFFHTMSSNLKTGQTLFRLYLGIGILGIAVILYDVPKPIKIFFSLFPHIAQMENLQCLFLIQTFQNKGFQLYFETYHKMSLFETIIYLIIDILFYIFGGLFIIKYNESGLDFISFILFKKNRIIKEKEEEEIINEEYSNINIYHEELNQKNKLLKEQNQMLNIVNVTRKYEDLIAVNKFKGELFPGEIFCLLGHNGAGKTTLIKMISGIEDPEEGDIFLNNKSLITNKDYLYENIGLCEQEDIFFDYLTVEEHLKYICEIKGNKADMEKINDLLIKIELNSKKKSECGTLSRGQKRKVCLALALIGDPQIVLLDEPTSGMDVIAKRSLWEFLKNYKENKIIILTTHSLDEAEYLGDRIGIMSEGRFLCSGTSSYLKDKYPCGYNLNLILNREKFTDENKNFILNGVKEIYPNYTIKVSSKTLLSLSFGIINEKTEDIFDYIENIKDKIGIEDYTISTTSLEDVFLKLNVNRNTKNMNDINLSEGLQIQNNPQDLHNEFPSFFSQIKIYFRKNFIQLYRNKINFLIDLILSLTIFFIFFITLKSYIDMGNTSYTNYLRLLTSNSIYVTDNTKEYLKKSISISKKVSPSYENIKFTPSTGNNTDIGIKFFAAQFYSYSNYYNEKAATFKYGNNSNITFLLLYQNAYYRDIMITLISSSYLADLGINAIIFDEWAQFPNENLKTSNIFVFFICGDIFLIITFLSFAGNILNPIVREKENNIKHLLYLSGGDMYAYWLGFWLVDIIKCLILIIICFGILCYYQFSYFILLVPVFFFFSLEMLLFIYFFSFTISTEEQAPKGYFNMLLITLVIIPALLSAFIFPILALLIYYVGNVFLSFFEPYFITIAEITPMTSLLMAIFRITISFYNDYLKKNFLRNVHVPKPYVLVITHCIYFIIESFIWLFLLNSCESGCLKKLWHYILNKFCLGKEYEFSVEVPVNDGYIFQNNYLKGNNITNNINNNNIQINESNNAILNEITTSSLFPNENSLNNPLIINNNNINNKSDLNRFVQQQKEKVRNDISLTTRISGLRKTFFFCCKKNLRAVNDLYLGLEANEKFGLLGFNGSGKSTIFKSITNEIYYEKGEITLFGFNSESSFRKIRTMIGYCPQENPLPNYLTVRELLTFYKSLKKSKESIESICKKFNLEKYIDKYCVNLSGGNKRKLTFAVALMNYPKILLLDEPSTGVDPESRRIMWKNINELSLTKNEYNMILSTHSMEEAEILCDTVSWLKSGNFNCVGNPEKLKILYSAGYNLHIKFKDDKIKEIEKENNDIEHKNICELKIVGGDFIMGLIGKNNKFEYYVDALYDILKLIKDKCDNITVIEIGKDLSFDLKIHVKKDKQGYLFNQILNMKIVIDIISEISINMESLENILTSIEL